MNAAELAKQLADTGLVTTGDAREHLPTIFDHVQDGRTVIVTRRGTPVGEIFPPGTDAVLGDVVVMLQVIREHGLGSSESADAVDAVAARCIPGCQGSWVRGG
jgi:antitoxin (DNA-binding transcriptional repressor) of toxin-antitoxin stability system